MFKRFIKQLIVAVVVFLALAALGLLVSGNGHIFTALSRTYFIGHSTANIDDHTSFETVMIDADEAQPWPEHEDFNKTPLPAALEDFLKQESAVAFLVIKSGKLLQEHYFQGYNRASQTNSFSMAKTVVTMLLDTAINDGYVAGLDQPVLDWLPEFEDDPLAAKATLGQLSDMTSGYDWDEAYYNPFSPTVKLLYGDDVSKLVLSRGFSDEPGSTFYYSSASTELLAIALSRALKQKDPTMSLASYASEKLWKPLGMNDRAPWHTDGQGMELAYCCINTNARNFAKLGQLLANNGRWDGEQILDPRFVQAMQTPQKVDDYGYSLWLNGANQPAFYQMQGHLGQYVIVVPSEELVIVRLGKKREKIIVKAAQDITPFYVEQAIALSQSPSQ